MNKKNVLKLMTISLILMIGCKKPPQTSSSVSNPETVPYTVGIQKKIYGLETSVQFWLSENIQFVVSTNNSGYTVDEKGVIIVNSDKTKNTLTIKRNTPGILVKEEKGIYWIRFDPEDERLVPFQRTGYADSDIFQLAVLSNNNLLVLLSDKRKYTKNSDPYLKISKKFASSLENNSKVAKGVKVNGEQ